MAAEKMSIDSKPQQVRRNDSDDSGASSPEREQTSAAPVNNTQENPQPKRKGGRKPIYATSEERKQRNRQAQAAFRERRTEYIKQLEETIRIHESNLHNLQTAHRTAADECLMLRYKNSLLERILLEKGIDVQAELQAKTGSPTLGPSHAPQNLVQPAPIQRAIMSRPRKSISAIAPKPDQNGRARPSVSAASAGSPTNTSSGFSTSASDSLSMRHPASAVPRQHDQGMMQPRGAGSNSYAFSSAGDPLDQDYDMKAEMMDDSELESGRTGSFATAYGDETSQSLLMSPTSQSSAPNGDHPFPTMNQLLDQNLDWDPFGLSASMAFPNTQFQFEHHTQMR